MIEYFFSMDINFFMYKYGFMPSLHLFNIKAASIKYKG